MARWRVATGRRARFCELLSKSGCLDPHSSLKPFAEVMRCASEAHVREPLREVAQVLAGKARFFRVKSEVVGAQQHLLDKPVDCAGYVPCGQEPQSARACKR